MAAPTPQDVFVQDGDASVAYFPSNEWQIFTNPEAYLDGSLHVSYNESATISFSFVGSYFWYFGDLNFDHGRYNISIDNGPGFIGTSYNAEILPVESLFSQALDPGPHAVTITNIDDSKLTGVDYFVYRPFTAEAVAETDQVVKGNDYTAVTYTPTEQWQGDAYHLTYNQGASVSFEFTGEYVWFFADRNFDHGAFKASIDGGAATTFTSYSAQWTESRPLFSRAVDPGHHILTITNAAEGLGLGIANFAYRPTTLAIDNSTATLSSATGSPSTANTPVSPQNSTAFPVGAIVGIVLGLVGIVLLGVMIFLLLRKHRRARMRERIPREILQTPQPWQQPFGVQYGAMSDDGPMEVPLPAYSESALDSRVLSGEYVANSSHPSTYPDSKV
ncbi:hypothetical protein EXIGLDRAFT_767848 [Exidia glandulosa HHB12029]|uniref:Transmembrane protein n=1 Tax=Exidia glandulosa HHB12029 TaxID=1314781 RepID=A0A165IN00_EXIGL|nr:hypothetical protein EXIGLDRAFT_767848 [Exidia glandulosa HHB12029]